MGRSPGHSGCEVLLAIRAWGPVQHLSRSAQGIVDDKVLSCLLEETQCRSIRKLPVWADQPPLPSWNPCSEAAA